MTVETTLLVVASALSIIFLSRLMRVRSAELVKLLKTHVEKQTEWSRKRARAAQLARQVARRQSVGETVSPQTIASDRPVRTEP